MQTHELLAQHYFLDALDFHQRFLTYWESAPRESSRVKSFIDLLMACECMLKSQCIIAYNAEPLSSAYERVKNLGHNIEKLSRNAEITFPSQAHEQARTYFGKFPVGLRYSVDTYHFFFPIIGSPPQNGLSYAHTLGNSIWMHQAEETVKALITWGKMRFCGEIDANIDSIMESETEINTAIARPKINQQKK
jgi:hypothetical protein